MVKSKSSPVIAMHWFRKGLRLHDNPALMASIEQEPMHLYPVYVLDGDSYQLLHCTALRANFLVECLQDLDANLRRRGSRLFVLDASVEDPATVLTKAWKEWEVTHLSFEKDETGEPYADKRDKQVIAAAQRNGIHVHAAPSETMYSLQAYMKKTGPKGVPVTMTGFQKLFKNMPKMIDPLDAPDILPKANDKEFCNRSHRPPKRPTDLPWPRNTPRDEVEYIWGPEDCKGLTPLVRGGESRALAQLKSSLADASWVAQFEKPKTSCTAVNKPSTTVLSPYLSSGCLSPRQVWFAIDKALERTKTIATKPPVSLHGQVLWRDFNNLMAHDANSSSPGCWNLMESNKHCRRVPWDDDPMLLNAWKQGKTGYPWIDACMRQLATEGWIHHLGRHAVACFLTRGDLWQSWEKGAQHFEATLLDADYALNGFNWMWLSCSGFFYQYFRCYSPIAFQKKSDPTGAYIRKYVPELTGLPAKYIYEPWKAPKTVLENAGILLGMDYPEPIVEHAETSKSNMNRMKAAYAEHKQSMVTTKSNGESSPSRKKRKTCNLNK